MSSSTAEVVPFPAGTDAPLSGVTGNSGLVKKIPASTSSVTSKVRDGNNSQVNLNSSEGCLVENHVQYPLHEHSVDGAIVREELFRKVLRIPDVTLPHFKEKEVPDILAYTVAAIHSSGVPTYILRRCPFLNVGYAEGNFNWCFLIIYQSSKSNSYQRASYRSQSVKFLWTMFLELAKDINLKDISLSWTSLGRIQESFKLFKTCSTSNVEESQFVNIVGGDTTEEKVRHFLLNFRPRAATKCPITREVTYHQLQHDDLDLRGMKLKIAASEYLKEAQIAIQEGKNYPSILDILDFKIVDILAKKYSFTYDIDDSGFSNLSDGGCFFGPIGVIQRHEADFCVSTVVITAERREVVDFSITYLNIGISFLIRAATEKPKDFALFHPFSATVWLSLVLALLFTSGTLYFTHHVVSSIRCHQSLHFNYIVWNLFATFTSKGASRSLSSGQVFQIIMASWWIFIVVVLNSYSGSLMSFITLPIKEKQIGTFWELSEAVRRNQYSVGALSRGFVERSLRERKTEITTILAQSMEEDGNVMEDIMEGSKRVLEKNYALIENDFDFMNVVMEKGPEKFFVSHDHLFIVPIGIVLPKGSPLKVKFDKVLRAVIEAGFIDHWYREELHKLHWTSQYGKEVRQQPLVLKDLKGIYYVVLIGYAASVCVLCVELFVAKCFRQRRKTGHSVSHNLI